MTADEVTGGIISSVVPQLDYTLERTCRTYLDIKPLMLVPGLKTGMNLRVDNAKEVGADRVVNNVSAVKKYGFPLIIIDFGTATTFNVIDAKGEFIGGGRSNVLNKSGKTEKNTRLHVCDGVFAYNRLRALYFHSRQLSRPVYKTVKRAFYSRSYYPIKF